MTNIIRRAFWFDDNKRPNVADVLEKAAGFEVDRLRFDDPEAINWPKITRAHAYCITSARDEVPDQYKCNAALLARCPDLLMVSTTGAGYDTVDLSACTAAGILAVNQAGANADAVAEHAMALLLAHAKRVVDLDRIMRDGGWSIRNSASTWELSGRTILLVGLGRVGRAMARRCLGFDLRVLAVDPATGPEALGVFFVDSGSDFQTMDDSMALYGDTGAAAISVSAFCMCCMCAAAYSRCRSRMRM